MLQSRSLEERILAEAEYIILTNSTIRMTARKFNVPKTTVHDDVTKRLYKINKNLYKEVRIILNYNLSQRAIRGGEATRKKYKNNSKNSM